MPARARLVACPSIAMTLTLLARAYCHLCDEMRDALAPLAAAGKAAITIVDVDADPALEAAWGDRVPVLFAGDPAPANELCHYRLDAARVAAALGITVASEPEIR